MKTIICLLMTALFMNSCVNSEPKLFTKGVEYEVGVSASDLNMNCDYISLALSSVRGKYVRQCTDDGQVTIVSIAESYGRTLKVWHEKGGDTYEFSVLLEGGTWHPWLEKDGSKYVIDEKIHAILENVEESTPGQVSATVRMLDALQKWRTSKCVK